MKCSTPINVKVEFSFFNHNMGCYDYESRIHTNNIRGVESYSRGSYIEFYCSLCGRFLGCNSDATCINWHFLATHTLKETTGNYVKKFRSGITMTNSIYHNSGRINGYRVCNISGIIKSNPHFIYLVHEFSFSDILNQFDEVEVSDWRLLASVRSKTFSCLLCGGMFESFPSNEVFAIHPCNEM